jgi:putative restriction endonuclease
MPIKGFVANTDFDWYTYLLARSHQTPLEEVNFWAPSKRSAINTIDEYGPFLFRLKSPYKAIAGFGFFRHASTVPLSLAWELFGDKNGASTLAKMRERIGRYRSDSGDLRDEVLIGCRTVVMPIFFEPDEWVREPKNWSGNIVVGKTYDLTKGEGARIWRQCYELGIMKRPDLAPTGDTPPNSEDRFGPPVEVRQRIGQGSFRMKVVDAYGRACAVTTEHSLPVLEAAHIKPYAQDGNHEVSNGVLLRSDLHRLFDRGYVTIDPDFKFRVSGQLREQWQNGRVYYELNERPIQLPKNEVMQPRRELLEWHRDEIYLG